MEMKSRKVRCVTGEVQEPNETKHEAEARRVPSL